jgi:hypothetical protein
MRLMRRTLLENEMRINSRLFTLAALTFIIITALPPAITGAGGLDDSAEVRQAVRRAFNRMKARQYDDLYDSLSSSSRSRISRQRFTSSMRRADDNYRLERMEVGAVRVRGDRAVVDTVIYAQVLKPVEGEGKLVSQQTLVREDGEWKVATGSPSAGLGNRNPRVYLKRDGRWVDLTQAMRAAARRKG